MVARTPLKLAVVGDPVAHSRSPVLQRGFMAEAGVEGTYEALRVRAGELGAALAALRAEGYAGLNVTTPLKEEAAALCDRLSPAAQALGAANTLVLRAHETFGANTDGAGGVSGARSGTRRRARQTRARARRGADGARGRLRARARRRRRLASGIARASGRGARRALRRPRVGRRLAARCGLRDASAGCERAAGDQAALRAAPLVLDANYGPRATLGCNLGRPVIDRCSDAGG